jgi:hypothetical protein
MEGDTQQDTRYTASACHTFHGSTDPISGAIDRRGAGPMILEILAVSAGHPGAGGSRQAAL